MTDAQWVDLLQTHCKLIERCGWQNMGYEQFIDSMLGFLKQLATHTVVLCKRRLRSSMAKAKLSLTPGEMDQFVDKLQNPWTHIKKRIRDAGSGTRLPKSFTSVMSVWKKFHGKKGKEKKEKKEKDTKEKQENQDKPDIRAAFGLPPRVLDQVDLVSLSSSATSLFEVQTEEKRHTLKPQTFKDLIAIHL